MRKKEAMDSTSVPSRNLAASNGDLDQRRSALPGAAWRHIDGFLHGWTPIMDRGRIRLLSGAVVLVGMVLLIFTGCAAPRNAVSPAPTIGGGSTFVATLIPEGTNTHGSGTARLQLNPDQQTICSMIHVTGIALPATAAHIHQGAAGINGPIVVHLPAPNAAGVSTGCTHAPRTLIAAIMQQPAGYYVNVHNAPYPEGAVRGQLAP
jgi:CHRD domain